MIALASYLMFIKKMVKSNKATIVPKVLIKTVLQVMHNHFGIGKMYYLIRRCYFWPKMIKHIQAHGIKFLTKFCSHVGVAHTPLMVRLHTLLCTIEIHQHPYIN